MVPIKGTLSPKQTLALVYLEDLTTFNAAAGSCDRSGRAGPSGRGFGVQGFFMGLGFIRVYMVYMSLYGFRVYKGL